MLSVQWIEVLEGLTLFLNAKVLICEWARDVADAAVCSQHSCSGAELLSAHAYNPLGAPSQAVLLRVQLSTCIRHTLYQHTET